jgi:pectate lyase-like protein
MPQILLLFIALLLAMCSGDTPVAAQGCGTTNPNCIVPTAPPATSNNQAASTAFVTSAVNGVVVNVKLPIGTCAAAVGNGSTNDRVAIQCHIDYATTTFGGGLVYVPCGTYLINGGGITIKTGVVVAGEAQQCADLTVTDDETAINFNVANTGQAAFGMQEIAVDCFQNVAATAHCFVASDLIGIGPGGHINHVRIWGGRCGMSLHGVGDWVFTDIYVAGWGTGGGADGVMSGSQGCNLRSVDGGSHFIRAKFDQSLTTISYSIVEIITGDAFYSTDSVSTCTNTNSGGPNNVCVYLNSTNISHLFRPSFVNSEIDGLYIGTATLVSVFGTSLDTAIGTGATLYIAGSYGLGAPVISGAGRSICSGTVNITCTVSYN